MNASEISQADAFVERWRERDGALRLAEVYASSPYWVVVLGLYFELVECLFRIGEPQVREAKLGWWLEEVGHFSAKHPRHPLSAALLAAKVRAQTLQALVSSAAHLLDTAAAPSVEELQRQRLPLLKALAELLMEAHGQPPENAADPSWPAALGVLDDCFRILSLGLTQKDPLPVLSLSQQAMLGVGRADFAGLPEAARAVHRRQLALSLPTPAPVPMPALGVYLSLSLSTLRRSGTAPRPGAWSALLAWRAARRWH